MVITERTLTATEESVLKNDLLDPQAWVAKAIDGKVANCTKRMIAEWLPKLYADESVTQIPASEDDVVALIVARDDYKNRADRDAAAQAANEPAAEEAPADETVVDVEPANTTTNTETATI